MSTSGSLLLGLYVRDPSQSGTDSPGVFIATALGFIATLIPGVLAIGLGLAALSGKVGKRSHALVGITLGSATIVVLLLIYRFS